jgi:hypothetical protein
LLAHLKLFSIKVFQSLASNYKEAFKWISNSAQQGNSDAQYLLGALYYSGQGVPVNNQQATKWWLKSAEQGHSSAQYHMGLMYHYGEFFLKIIILPLSGI